MAAAMRMIRINAYNCKCVDCVKDIPTCTPPAPAMPYIASRKAGVLGDKIPTRLAPFPFK